MRNHDGFTLLELLLVLTICGLLAAAAVPRLGHGRRVIAVRAAANELATLAALARAKAIAANGAALVIDTRDGTAWIETAGTITSHTHIGRRFGVVIESDRTSPLQIRYDGIGVGRFAAATIRTRSGAVTATLTVSGYGRVRT